MLIQLSITSNPFDYQRQDSHTTLPTTKKKISKISMNKFPRFIKKSFYPRHLNHVDTGRKDALHLNKKG